MLKKSLQKISLALAAVAFATPAWADLTIKIKNDNPAYSDSNIHVYFSGGEIVSPTIQPYKVYSLDQVKNGIVISRAIAGRMYVYLGPCTWTPDQAHPDPEPVNPGVASWNGRFDKIELTYTPTDPSSCANLTTVDYFAIPMSLQSFKGGKGEQHLGYAVDGNQMISLLGGLSNNSPKAVLKSSDGKFLRVVAPKTLPPHEAHVYPSLQKYVDAVKASGQPILIEDHFYREGGSPAEKTQKYNFTAKFEPNGDLHLDGGGDLVGPGHKIIIKAKDLVDNIYGANPPYTVDGKASWISDNNVYSAATRDVLAGFDYGFIGSETIDPATQKAFGTEPSRDWWKSSKVFEFLQPKEPFYDRWSQIIKDNSDSYGYAFSDRWQKVHLHLHGVDTMELTILPDGPAR